MIRDSKKQTIVARCTPQGSGALALIRISGENAFNIACFISKLPNNKQINQLPTHTIHYGSVIDHNERTVDHVMFLLMRGPHSFTGDDTVEITCHNNPFIIEKIIELTIAHGARHAQAGEFAQRAFLNNKIDLLQAEAINELIHASNQVALRQSLEQLEGSFSHWLANIEKSLVKCLAFSEASFEFIDEEHMEFGNTIKNELQKNLIQIATLKKTFDQQEQIRQGVRIAFIGSVNAGKSSLFNALLNQQRAIVTDIPGTTRDVIEAGFYAQGTYVTLIDTAGLRHTDDLIEKEGIARSHQEAQKADIILLIYDQSRPMTSEEHSIYKNFYELFKNKTLVIANKSDLPTQPVNFIDHAVLCSSIKKESITILEKEIFHKISELLNTLESPFLLNQRHYKLLLGLEKNLQEIMAMLNAEIEYVLLSFHIKETLESLTEFTGKTISEKGMDAVFREFCVGK
jgi:tRNA modification GTPase